MLQSNQKSIGIQNNRNKNISSDIVFISQNVQKIAIAHAVVFFFVIFAEYNMWRSVFGPDNKFWRWEWNILSSENSQRLTDPYVFTHFLHGLLFFGIIFLFTSRFKINTSFYKKMYIVLAIESIWEILENSPWIIDRYRQTVSLWYTGDSILNSCFDIVAMTIGFCFAYRFPSRLSIMVFVTIEIVLWYMIRDNLILNIIMLLHPFQIIKTRQLSLGL